MLEHVRQKTFSKMDPLRCAHPTRPTIQAKKNTRLEHGHRSVPTKFKQKSNRTQTELLTFCDTLDVFCQRRVAREEFCLKKTMVFPMFSVFCWKRYPQCSVRQPRVLSERLTELHPVLFDMWLALSKKKK